MHAVRLALIIFCGRDASLGASLDETASGVDLGGCNKYSNENPVVLQENKSLRNSSQVKFCS